MSKTRFLVVLSGLGVLALPAQAQQAVSPRAQAQMPGNSDATAEQDPAAVQREIQALENRVRLYAWQAQLLITPTVGGVAIEAVASELRGRFAAVREEVEALGSSEGPLSDAFQDLENMIRDHAPELWSPAIVAAAGTGIISGTVSDAGTGAGVSGIQVEFYDCRGSFVTSATTASGGAYTTPAAFGTGTYYARTYNFSSSISYLDQLYSGGACPRRRCTVTNGTPIPVTNGVTTPNINFALSAGGRVSGTLRDAVTTATLASAEADIYDANGRYITYGSTNSSGVYTTLGGIPSGTYYARTFNFSSNNYLDKVYGDFTCVGFSSSFCKVAVGLPFTVTAGSIKTGVDFNLVKGGSISGTVTDALNSAAVSGLEVDVYDSSGTWVTYGFTGSSGTYASYGGLLPGTYYTRTFVGSSSSYLNRLYNGISCDTSCTVTNGTAITVSTGAATTGINFQLSTGGVIQGTVTNAAGGTAISSVSVSVYNSSGSFVKSSSSDSSGLYAVRGLAAGTYYARTSASSASYRNVLYNGLPCAPSCTVTNGTAITVAQGSTTGSINFSLVAVSTGTVSGTVTDAGNGAPLPGVFVGFYDGSSFYGSSTDCSGNYSLSVPAGTVYAYTFGDPRHVGKTYSGFPCTLLGCYTADVIAGNPITVTGGGTTGGVNFALAPGGQVTGTVSNAQNSFPTAFCSVSLYSATGGFLNSRSTDYSGVYASSLGLDPGTYYARASCSGFDTQLYSGLPCPGGTCTVTTGTPIAVNTGATTSGINFSMSRPPTLTIWGRAVAEGNAANASFLVTLSPPSASTVTVGYSTVNDTATAPSDFASASGTLSFSPGRFSHSIYVPIVSDTTPEGAETFFMTLTNPTNASIGIGTGQGAILDPPTPAKVRMFRAYNPNAFYHFFTTARPEFDNAVAAGYRDETTGLTGFCIPNTAQTSTASIFRMYNPNTGRHYYSVGTGERDSLVAVGWVYEKDEGSIFTSQVPGSTEIFKLYNNISGVHLYTEDPNTKDGILAQFPGIWFQHTSLGYAFASPAAGTCPP